MSDFLAPSDASGADGLRAATAARILPAPYGLSPQEISRAISFARITLIVGLVFVHFDMFPNSAVSPLAGLDINAHSFATWVNSTIQFLFYTVVPLLSMISGWLFFSFKPEDAGTVIRRRMKRRFVSLYLPLVGWNMIYLAGVLALLAMNPDHPLFKEFTFKFPIAHWMDYINAVFAVTHRPLAFQFWFVRDLFMSAMVSPILWLFIRRAPWVGGIILCAAWLMYWHLVVFFRPDVVFFFYLGGLVHQKKVTITVSLRIVAVLTVIYLVWGGLRALAPYAVAFDGETGPFWLDIVTRLMRIVGVIGCWGIMYRVAQLPMGRRIGHYGGVAFFLHAAHWPLLALIKIYLWPLMPGQSDGWMLVFYLASVAITVAIGFGLGVLLALKVPNVFALMNGGRALEDARSKSAPA